MNQYVVDNAEQTSSAGLPGAFGAYRLLTWAPTWKVWTHNPARRVDGGLTISTAQLLIFDKHSNIRMGDRPVSRRRRREVCGAAFA